MKFNIQDHILVPTHELMSEEEVLEEFADVDYEVSDLPKIKLDDPVVKALSKESEVKIKPGDVLRITRDSQTAGVYVTYRIVED